MKNITFTLATLATIMLGSSLFAQKPDKASATKPDLPASQEGRASTNSKQELIAEAQEASSQTKQRMFAKCLAIANQEQVDLAHYAAEKATNEEVKQFAAAMEKSHSACVEQLNGVFAEDKATRRPAKPGAQPTEAAVVSDFLRLHQEIATQCLEDSKEYLSTKEAADFDKCFVSMQIAKHASMHSALTVLQRHTQGKLQEIVKSGLEENDQHMGLALKLMTQLTANDASIASKSSK